MTDINLISPTLAFDAFCFYFFRIQEAWSSKSERVSDFGQILTLKFSVFTKKLN